LTYPSVIEFPIFSRSEDFVYYLEKIPGFFNVGCEPIDAKHVYQNHHPTFDFAEDALLVSEKSVGDVVCHYVGREKSLCYN